MTWDEREELKELGFNEALFEGCVNDPAFWEAIRNINKQPLTRRERKELMRAEMRELRKALREDAVIEDLERELNRSPDDDSPAT